MLKIKTAAKIFALFALSAVSLVSYADSPIASSRQVIIVTGTNWESTTGMLQRYERVNLNTPWQKVGNEIDVNLGKNGMGWGTGLHGDTPLTEGPVVDREGLRRSPVGAFEIPLVFGKDLATDWSVNLPYQQISPSVFCPDDSRSKNYNRIVDLESTAKDWESAEDMQGYVNEGLYIYGAMIGHNSNPIISGHGSCFFIHIWRGPNRPTGGCTAMAANNAKEVISWLDPQKNPVLVQLPGVIYSEIQSKWELPDLQTSTVNKEL